MIRILTALAIVLCPSLHLSSWAGEPSNKLTAAYGTITSGHAIPGLYACGDVVALEHVGVGFQAGLPLAGAMTFRWRAAQHAAQKFF
jgi:succinate dehydrogenase/fumarate reductase flavoprotein subunit